MNCIFGINAVVEALKSRGRSFEWVGVAKERKDLRLQKLIQECRNNSIPVRFLPRVELDRMAATASHQGVVAVTSSKQYADLDDIVEAKRGEYALIVVLDGVDPNPEGDLVPDPRPDRAQAFAQQPRPPVDSAAPAVGAGVHRRRQELVEQVAMTGVELDRIEAGLHAPLGSVGELADHLGDVVLGRDLVLDLRRRQHERRRHGAHLVGGEHRRPPVGMGRKPFSLAEWPSRKVN